MPPVTKFNFGKNNEGALPKDQQPQQPGPPKLFEDCCQRLLTQIEDLTRKAGNGKLTQGLLNQSIKSILENAGGFDGSKLASIQTSLDTLLNKYSSGAVSAGAIDLSGLQYASKFIEVLGVKSQLATSLNSSPQADRATQQVLREKILEMNSLSQAVKNPELTQKIAEIGQRFQTTLPQTQRPSEQATAPQGQRAAFTFGKKTTEHSTQQTSTPVAPKLTRDRCCDPQAMAEELQRAMKLIERGKATQGFIKEVLEEARVLAKNTPSTDPAGQRLKEEVSRVIETAQTKKVFSAEQAKEYKNKFAPAAKENPTSREAKPAEPASTVKQAAATTFPDAAAQKQAATSKTDLPKEPTRMEARAENPMAKKTAEVDSNRHIQSKEAAKQQAPEERFTRNREIPKTSDFISSRDPANISRHISSEVSTDRVRYNQILAQRSDSRDVNTSERRYTSQISEQRIVSRIEQTERMLNSARVSDEIFRRQLAHLTKDLSQVSNPSTQAYERSRQLLENAQRQNNLQRAEPAILRIQNLITNRQFIDESSRLLRALNTRQLPVDALLKLGSDVSRAIRNLMPASLSEATLGRLRLLSQHLEKLLSGQSREAIASNKALTQLELLRRQVQQLLAINQKLTGPEAAAQIRNLATVRESRQLQMLSQREKILLASIEQIKESLKLQQRFLKQQGENISPADKIQLKLQERLLLRQLALIEKELSRLRGRKDDISLRLRERLLAQIQGLAASSDLNRRIIKFSIDPRFLTREARIQAVEDRIAKLTQRLKDLQLLMKIDQNRLGSKADLLKQSEILQRQLKRLEAQLDRLKNGNIETDSRLARLRQAMLMRSLNAENVNRMHRLREALRNRGTDNSPLGRELRELNAIRRQALVLRSDVRDLLNSILRQQNIRLSSADLQSQIQGRLSKLLAILNQKEHLSSEQQNRLKRLQAIYQALSESQNLISVELLMEMLELLEDEMGESVKKSKRISKQLRKKSLKSSNQSNDNRVGFGLKVEEELRAKISKATQSSQKTNVRVVSNAKTGNIITASTTMPSRSLDVVQSKEDDGEKNEYWKEVYNENVS